MIMTTTVTMVEMTSADDEQQQQSNHNNHNHNHNTATTTNKSNGGYDYSEEDVEAANTLLDLPYLITKNLSFYRFPLSWIGKRKRSVLDNPPSPPTPPPPSLQPPLRKEVVPLLPPPPLSLPLKAVTSSPDTPLSFSACESDGIKSMRQPSLLVKKKTSVKRSKEELQVMVDERLQTKHILLGEIKKVKLHLKNLKPQNLELKAEKHKLILNGVDERREEAQLEACQGLNLFNPMTECIQPRPTVLDDHLHAGPSTSTQDRYQQPLFRQLSESIMNLAANKEPAPYQQLGPRGFDLNAPAEEFAVSESVLQPFDQGPFVNKVIRDFNRAQARVAREKRRLIIRSKRPARGG